MNKKIEDAFNEQINAELHSSYLYLSMVHYFASKNLDGFVSWMQIQTDEERIHAMKFQSFINDRGGRVVLKQIDEPRFEWPGPLDAFQEAYEHECMISGRINDLINLAGAEGDHAAVTFLQWFVTEQVEEEATAQAVVEKLKMIGDNPVGLLMMDQQLGQRTAAAPVDTQA